MMKFEIAWFKWKIENLHWIYTEVQTSNGCIFNLSHFLYMVYEVFNMFKFKFFIFEMLYVDLEKFLDQLRSSSQNIT